MTVESLLAEAPQRTRAFLSQDHSNLQEFALVGPPKAVVIEPWGYVALFPLPPNAAVHLYHAHSFDLGQDIRFAYSQILSVELPEHAGMVLVKDEWKRPSSSDVMARAAELDSAHRRLPSIVLAVGDIRHPDEEVVRLITVLGKNPHQAFQTMQLRVQEDMEKSAVVTV